MGNTPATAELSYPDFSGMTREEKVEALYRYVMNGPEKMVTLSARDASGNLVNVSVRDGSEKKLVTLPEPITFIHENVITKSSGQLSDVNREAIINALERP